MFGSVIELLRVCLENVTEIIYKRGYQFHIPRRTIVIY